MDAKTTSTPPTYFGLILLLVTLAAPPMDVTRSQVKKGAFAEASPYNRHAPYLTYAASLLGDIKTTGTGSVNDDDEEEEAIVNRILAKDRRQWHKDDNIVPKIMAYLPFTSLAATRRVSTKWSDLSRVSYDPRVGAMFMYLPRGELYRADASLTTTRATTPPSAARRLFVGQLRKEGTANLLWWMTAMMCPNVTVDHIESHTNPRQGGRGKGCAWMYLASPRDMAVVVGLHRRVFVDADVEGREGIWVCGPSALDMDRLSAFATQRSYDNRAMVLPRNCLVVEMPANRQSGPVYQPAPPLMSAYLRPPPPPPSRIERCACYGCQYAPFVHPYYQTGY